MIKPQNPVRLITPVLPQKRRPASVVRTQVSVCVHSDKCRVKDSFQVKSAVKCLGRIQDLVIRFRRSSYDHLRALSRGDKAWRLLIQRDLLSVFRCLLLHKPHRSQYILSGLMRSKKPQSLCSRKFYIDAHAVGQESCETDQPLVSPRYRFHMDVSLKIIDMP